MANEIQIPPIVEILQQANSQNLQYSLSTVYPNDNRVDSVNHIEHILVSCEEEHQDSN
jgi:hypothetical protein